MGDHVVTLNAGSSSIKFALFASEIGWPRRIAFGEVEGLGGEPVFVARMGANETADRRPLAEGRAVDHEQATRFILAWIEHAQPGARVTAIGHRVVHGGTKFSAPAIIDEAALAALRQLSPLAPLHQPHNIAGIEAAAAAFPRVPQVACFDTAFHRGHAFVHDAYALPRRYYAEGIRRYGFHGLSYEYIARRMREIAPVEACGRVIVAHLGNGASACAMRDGRSIASTMGFTALEGLPMGTRSGDIDPGVILYLLEEKGMDAAALSRLLYREAGLKGLSGLSQDMRDLEASEQPDAQEAVAYFIVRVRMAIGALTAALGGLDALVFTAGIGEHSSRVRAGVIEGLDWLGLALDAKANANHAETISTTASSVHAFVIPSDEEAMIAHHSIETAGLSRSNGPA